MLAMLMYFSQYQCSMSRAFPRHKVFIPCQEEIIGNPLKILNDFVKKIKLQNNL